MLVRIVGNTVRLIRAVPGSMEEEFAKRNAGYRVVESLPPSKFGHWMLGPDGEIVTDVEADNKAWAKNLIRDAQSIADKKTAAAKAYLAGKPYVSDNQQERYEQKYYIAKDYIANQADDLASLLQPEADAVGMSVADLAALIVQMGDQWRQAVAAYAVMIDGGRVAVGKLVEAGRLDRAQWLLDRLSQLGADATPTDLSALIAEANQTQGAS